MPKTKCKKDSQRTEDWYLAADQSYKLNGVLQLGQILTDCTDPKSAILTEATVRIPDDMLNKKHDDQGVNYKSSKPIQTTFKAWLKAVSRLSADSYLNKKLRKVYEVMFEDYSLSAITFKHSEDYVEEALSLKDPYRDVTNQGIWLVTGLRIVAKRTKISQGFIDRATGSAERDGSANEIPILAVLNDWCPDPLIYSYRLNKITPG